MLKCGLQEAQRQVDAGADVREIQAKVRRGDEPMSGRNRKVRVLPPGPGRLSKLP